jgi:imidazolonepropionase-like amidohydrolase
LIQPGDNLKVLVPGKLIDGVKATPQKGMAVAFQNGLITWVGRKGDVENLPDDGSREISDFPNSTLLPGLFDCHTHTNMPGDGRTGEDIDRDSDDLRLLRAARNSAAAVYTGVTSLCDCGSWNRTGFSLKAGLAQGLADGPRILVSGPPLTVTGGHLWYMGGEANGTDGVRQQVRSLIKEGADFIKIAASGGSTLTSDPYRPAYSAEEVQAIVDEAHNRDKPVLAHCRCTAAVNLALDVGVDAILHCAFYDADGAYRFDDATADRLAASDTWLNPTMHMSRASQAALKQIKEERDLTADEQERLERSQRGGEASMNQFGRLIQAGVKLVGGSDCGWGHYPFGDFQGELLAMADAGLSPMQAILAGTLNGATALRLRDATGSIEKGKAADLLLVEGDPVQDLAALRQVTAVFKAGAPVESARPAIVTG